MEWTLHWRRLHYWLRQQRLLLLLLLLLPAPPPAPVCGCVCCVAFLTQPNRFIPSQVSCTVDGTYTCEWQDDRRPAHVRHSDAAAEPDVGSGSVSLASIAHVLQTINHIIFADTSQETADAGAIPRGEKPLVLHLQRMDDRAAVRRVTVWTDAHGQLQRFHVCDGAAASTIVHTHAGALMAILKEMCGGEGAPSPPSTHRSRWVVIRSPMWAEMPSELWWHILKLFTQREGRAVSCACKCIAQTVALPAFIWLHEKIHLDILHASDGKLSVRATALAACGVSLARVSPELD